MHSLSRIVSASVRHPIVLSLLLAFRPAAAQTGSVERGDTLRAAVTYLTAEYVYLSVGRRQGIHNGDTLSVVRPVGPDGRLVVAGTADERSLATFHDTAFDVAIGDTLLVFRRAVGFPTISAPSADRVDRASLLERRIPQRPIATRRRPIRLFGTIRANLNALRTAVGGAGLFDPTARTYASPSLSVRVTAADLPGGWDARADIRLSRRFSSHSIVSDATQTRVYRISLRRSVASSPFEVEAGRFPLRQDAARTYWDGVRGAVVGRRVSFGMAVGFDPDRYNGVVRSDLPKAAAYAEVDLRPGAWKMTTLLSGAHVMAGNDRFEHSYVGVEQRIAAGNLRADGELVVDRDPERGSWTATRLQLRAVVPLAAGLAASARYRERRPYSYWRTTSVIGARRTQQSVGLRWSARRASIRVGWTGNTAAASVRSDAWTFTAYHRDLPLWRLGVSASGGTWGRTGATSRYVAVMLTKPVGDGRVSVGWRMNESSAGIRSTRSQSVRIAIAAPIVGRFRADGSTQYHFGSSPSGFNVNLGLSLSF